MATTISGSSSAAQNNEVQPAVRHARSKRPRSRCASPSLKILIFTVKVVFQAKHASLIGPVCAVPLFDELAAFHKAVG